MGLAERRAINDFQTKHLPTLTKQIQDLAGFPVPVEITWEELAVEGQSSLYEEAWPALYFTPVIDALQQIARDDMGKAALKAGLKKIEFRNTSGFSSPNSAIKFEKGVLLIDHSVSNLGDVGDRTKYIIEIVEKAL